MLIRAEFYCQFYFQSRCFNQQNNLLRNFKKEIHLNDGKSKANHKSKRTKVEKTIKSVVTDKLAYYTLPWTPTRSGKHTERDPFEQLGKQGLSQPTGHSALYQHWFNIVCRINVVSTLCAEWMSKQGSVVTYKFACDVTLPALNTKLERKLAMQHTLSSTQN